MHKVWKSETQKELVAVHKLPVTCEFIFGLVFQSSISVCYESALKF